MPLVNFLTNNVGKLKVEGKRLELSTAINMTDFAWRVLLQDSITKLETVNQNVESTDSTITGILNTLQSRLQVLQDEINAKLAEKQIKLGEILDLRKKIEKTDIDISEAEKKASENKQLAKDMEGRKDLWQLGSDCVGKGSAALTGFIGGTLIISGLYKYRSHVDMFFLYINQLNVYLFLFKNL